MTTLIVTDQTLSRLRAAAAARKVSLDAYLQELASRDARDHRPSEHEPSAELQRRRAAAESIRGLAALLQNRATIAELITDKHAGHKH